MSYDWKGERTRRTLVIKRLVVGGITVLLFIIALAPLLSQSS